MIRWSKLSYHFNLAFDALLCTALAHLLIQSFLHVGLATLNRFPWKQLLIIKVLVMSIMHSFFFLLPAVAANSMLLSFYLAVVLMLRLITIEPKLFPCLMSNKRIDKNFSNHNLSIFVCCLIYWLSPCFLPLLFLRLVLTSVVCWSTSRLLLIFIYNAVYWFKDTLLLSIHWSCQNSACSNKLTLFHNIYIRKSAVWLLYFLMYKMFPLFDIQ